VYIVNAMNKNQTQKMQDLAKRLGVSWVTFTSMQVNDYNREIVLREVRKGQKGNRALPACFNAWFNIIVRLDGSITSCNRIRQMRGCDLKKRSFKQVWLSRHMMNMRLMEKYGYIQKVFKECQACSYYYKNIQRLQALEEEEFYDP
jgi:radical SAM protein with 4Fe4S-binding SPASM domain